MIILKLSITCKQHCLQFFSFLSAMPTTPILTVASKQFLSTSQYCPLLCGHTSYMYMYMAKLLSRNEIIKCMHFFF